MDKAVRHFDNYWIVPIFTQHPCDGFKSCLHCRIHGLSENLKKCVLKIVVLDVHTLNEQVKSGIFVLKNTDSILGWFSINRGLMIVKYSLGGASSQDVDFSACW